MTAIDERALEAARRAYEAKERDAFGPCPTEHPDDGGGPLGYAITACLQALRPGSTGETEGWVLVPREATEAMIAAAIGPDDSTIFGSRKLAAMSMAARYRAMLAAAGGR